MEKSQRLITADLHLAADSQLLLLPKKKKKTHAFACMGIAFRQLFNAELIEPRVGV